MVEKHFVYKKADVLLRLMMKNNCYSYVTNKIKTAKDIGIYIDKTVGDLVI